MEPTVFLFDMDGVLVKPGGYRAAVQATVNHFSNLLGLGDIAPDDETIGLFEAEGITSEWDMIPILLALALEAALAAHAYHGQPSIPDFQSACDWLNRYPPAHFTIDFAPLLRGMHRLVRIGEAPTKSILAAARKGQVDDLFPRLSRQAVLADLFSDTRHLIHSRTTAVLETFVLGDAVYTQITGLPVAVRSNSLLEQYDEPLLSAQTRDHLRQLRDQSGLRLSVYTARPSKSDDGLRELLAVFAPEAEMALGRVGWPDLMVVGTGQAGEMAWNLGVGEDRLTKPAPYHAVAAIASAWTGNRKAALAWTEQVFCFFEKDRHSPVDRHSPARPSLLTGAGPLPANLQMHIFEDSPSGMQGGKLAADLLAELGMQVKLSLWGVSSHPEKVAALTAVGAQVYPDINQAVDAALRTIPGV